MWFTPTLGIRPPTLCLLYYLLSIFYMHRAIKSYFAYDRRSAHTPLDPPSPSRSKNKALHNLLQSLPLSLANLTHHAQSVYNYYLNLTLNITHLRPLLLTSPRFLIIYYKMGLNMGEPMGRNPHTCYISQIQKIPKKGAEIS
jgi:hypothetical protein